MCGIAGIVNFDGSPVNPGALYAMSQTIYHRGPDDEGYCLIDQNNSEKIQLCGLRSNSQVRQDYKSIIEFPPQPSYNAGFAHRRFSIIDLSHAGHQPFTLPDISIVIIYNGEVYNYKELRGELEASGCSFHTHCDTEVVARAYQHWGTDCFSKFNGFWSIAIFDPVTKEIILSRDRMGVKPLYYTHYKNSFFFASEMKAIIAILPHLRSCNEQLINDWLRYGIKDHTHETFFSGIHSFPQGCWAAVKKSERFEIHRFWSLPSERRSEKEYSIDNAISELRELLTDAVRVRLRADVPLAIQLSGGMDSSAIAAIAHNELNVKLSAYTVKFEDPGADEERFARMVAERCCGDYHVISPPAMSIWSDIDKFTWLAEEPYHLPNLYTDQQILAVMRKNGIKVTLNGASGDENFCGYRFHYTLQQLSKLKHINILNYITMAIRCQDTPSWWHPFVYPIAYVLVKKLLLSDPKSTDLHVRLIQDMISTLMPYWLSSGDRSYMGVPIEIREPFLDYRIVEFAFKLPINYLIRDGWQKWILRKAMEPYLPSDIIWRKRKMGNPFPMKSFLLKNQQQVAILCGKNGLPLSFRNRNPGDIWKYLSFLLWKEWYINNNKDLFRLLKATLQPDSCWEFLPGYFSTFKEIESAG